MRLSQIRSMTDEKAELRNLRPLLPYLKPYVRSIAGAALALLVTSSSVLGLGKGIGYLVDQGLGANNPSLLNLALAILLLMTALLAASTYARFFLITFVGERVIADIRRDIYSHILSLSPEFFERTKPGDILAKLTIDTTLLQAVVGSSLSIALRNTLMLLGGAALLVHTSPKLAMLVSIVVPLVVGPIVLMGKKLRTSSRIAQDKIALLSSHAEESIHGIKTIQSFVRESLERTYFQNYVEQSLSAAFTRIRIRALMTALVILFIFGAIGIVLWIGGHDVLSGQMTAGQLSSFIFYSIVVAGSTGAISEVAGDLQRAAGAAERISELLATRPAINESPVPMPLSADIRGDIAFEGISFSYPAAPDKSSLHNFSLKVHNGETIALVGHSGAGKTTVFQLLLRFYDAQKGRITIDGLPLHELRLSEVRGLFGLVPQEPVIFSGTAYENILFGNPGASKEEVVKAAKDAAALEFIEGLPQGFDTYLGEKGVRISGGEKQRIAIARMLLKNPKILLLDEATSALDIENEQLVQNAFKQLMHGRTTLVIAHRLSTVQNANRIVVMDKGEIVEIGSHKELIEQKGLYARLVNMAFSE